MKPAKSVYIFIGPPGSGKGTLSHLCVKTLGWVQLSTGNLCRKHIAEQTEIGKQIDFALKSGKLVSDDLINSMVFEWFISITKLTSNIILDGYPRTVAQAQAFHTFLQQKLPDVSVQIIRFFISNESVITRISERLVCCNKDCQEVYSLNPEARRPIVPMKCDVCLSVLGKRNDDVIAAAQDRLQTYYKHEHDLLEFYKQASYPFQEIAVDKNIDEVFKDFKALVGIGRV